jgi:WD40 repeat protein
LPPPAGGFSPRGGSPPPGGHDFDIHLWDAATGVELGRCEGHKSLVKCLGFSPADDQYLVSGSWDGSIRLWHVGRRQELNHFWVPQPGGVIRVGFSPDGRRVQAWTESALVPPPSLKWWDIGPAEPCRGDVTTIMPWHQVKPHELRRYESDRADWRCVGLSPDGTQFLCGCRDQTVALWDVATGKEVRRFQGPAGQVYGAAMSPDGRHAATGGNDRLLRLWDVATGREVHRFAHHATPIYGVAFTADGRRVVTASARAVSLWEVPAR